MVRSSQSLRRRNLTKHPHNPRGRRPQSGQIVLSHAIAVSAGFDVHQASQSHNSRANCTIEGWPKKALTLAANPDMFMRTLSQPYSHRLFRYLWTDTR
jgi:hypothetical protein